MSFLSSNRSVLVLGDEGLQIYRVSRVSTRLIEFLPWSDESLEDKLGYALVKQCKRKPVVIINDMVEQHYRKERVPKVGVMDRANVLKRRLNVAFPNYKIRAALKLDNKKSLVSSDAKGLPYLFAAVPSSDNLSKVIKTIHATNVSIVGFYLLPLEAATMVKGLASKVSKKSLSGKATWNIFMGQHQNGGVRQIVTRDGELALTRMSPIVDTDVEPDLWAKEMSSELMATMSYLARFGYDESDGLNIFVIANETVEQALRDEVTVDCDLHILTSHQAAKMVGVNIGQQADARYADSLHAGYLGKAKKFRLPMQFAAIDGVKNPQRIASFLALCLLGLCGYLGYGAIGNWANAQKIDEDFRVSEERKKSIQQDYELELAKKKEVGFDFVMVSNSVEVFNDIQGQKIEPLSLLKSMAQSLGTDLHLDELSVKSKIVKPKAQNPFAYQPPEQKAAPPKKIMEAVMALSFPSDIEPELGVRKINNLKTSLEVLLPNYKVEIVKQVAGLSHTGNFVGEAGSDKDDKGNQDYKAEILVREIAP